MKKLFFEESHVGLPPVKPAKKFMPDWYGLLPRTIKGHPVVKSCVPFMDSFLVGYQIPLIAEVQVTIENDLPFYKWRNGDLKIVEVRNAVGMDNFPRGKGYHNDSPAWVTHHTIRIPKGYSALITHPLNRFDLPFTTLSAVVDDFDLHTGKLPFMLKSGFTGLIPQGTPIGHIIPFKREDWKLERLPGLTKEGEIGALKSSLVFSGWYRKNIWKKKSYD